MSKKKHMMKDVFGVGNRVPLTYVTRNYVDGVFSKAVSRGKHIAIYGSSKQGKTSLRRKHISNKDQIVISCTTSISRSQIYSTILRKVGVWIPTMKTEDNRASTSIEGKIDAEVNVVLAKGKGGLASAIGSQRGKEKTSSKMPIDPENCNDIIDTLKEIQFDRWIVLDDFHYLPLVVQYEIATDLKAFFDESDIRFILIGVWLEPDRLYRLNRDLQDRLIHINANRWDISELEEVLNIGGDLLNLWFSRAVRDKLIYFSQNNVGLLQTAAELICDKIGITKTQSNQLFIYDDFEKGGRASNYHGGPIEIWLSELHQKRAPRYTKFLSEFSHNYEFENPLFPFIAYALMSIAYQKIKDGASLHDIHKEAAIAYSYSLKGFRGHSLQLPDLRSAASCINSVVEKIGMQPPIIEYDDTKEMFFILDGGFFMYRNYQSRESLMATIGLPNFVPQIKGKM